MAASIILKGDFRTGSVDEAKEIVRISSSKLCDVGTLVTWLFKKLIFNRAYQNVTFLSAQTL